MDFRRKKMTQIQIKINYKYRMKDGWFVIENEDGEGNYQIYTYNSRLKEHKRIRLCKESADEMIRFLSVK